MARIAGVNIPNQKNLEIGLSYLFGVGRNNAKVIVEACNLDLARKIGQLTDEEIEKLRQYIDQHIKVEGDLKMEINSNIKRLKEIGAYRGVRHARNLPVHGQRTKTNARTKRGKKVTMGSGRRKSADKT
ncbi:MAG: small subunit ribosomal protein S13 [Candidatus Berkelbacteria bacterium Gr01-1014_85]|uniref:Small ribosomal subunit protein uS13 n=1 Tax=Candidatus Berkelbacteria bacterium Gr01-1014_85 TaxID=2017150 RepID=A0A554JAI5_9BACT|nr:MAG: small subunit ribosomal protein S13 [Candidatus Berkelbacteria bacterium Gr01-1014_85]